MFREHIEKAIRDVQTTMMSGDDGLEWATNYRTIMAKALSNMKKACKRTHARCMITYSK